MKIVEGKEYIVTSNANRPAICLKEICTGRALFVIPHNMITPFVSWAYNIRGGENEIDCGSGEYFKTFAAAIKAVANE